MRSSAPLLLLLGAMALPGCPPGAVHRNPGEAPDDARIHAELKARLAEDSRVDAGSVQVEVREGVVTLIGWVGDGEESQTVEKLAWSMKGVKKVRNLLQVRGGPAGSASSP